MTLKLNPVYSLSDYQQAAVTVMRRKEKQGVGGGLFMEMGLGKTYTVIAHIIKDLLKFPHRKTFIVVPGSHLMMQWVSEFTKFVSNFDTQRLIYCYHSPAQKRNIAANRNAAKKSIVMITTYQTLVIDAQKDPNTLLHYLFGISKRVVLDEAQYIKNSVSKTWKALLELVSPAQFRWCLTGTPYNNSIQDLESLARFMGVPKYSTQSFWVSVQKALKNDHQTDYGHELIAEFLEQCVILETKERSDTRLPEKETFNCKMELTGAQKMVYQTCKLDCICLYQDYKTRKISYQCLLQKISELRRITNMVNYHGKLLSVKWRFLIKKLKELKKQFPKDKVIVFSQFPSDFYLMEQKLVEEGISPLFYTGKMDLEQKQKTTRKFERKECYQTMFVSIRCGGTGLNLTMANRVFIMDLTFNPFVVKQAIDRVHRIGQKKPVVIYQLIVKGTVEEWMHALAKYKLFMAEYLLLGKASGTSTVTVTELDQLFSVHVPSLPENVNLMFPKSVQKQTPKKRRRNKQLTKCVLIDPYSE